MYTLSAWPEPTLRTPGSGNPSPGSRTRRCCAARAGTSTISTRFRTPVTLRSCAASSAHARIGRLDSSGCARPRRSRRRADGGRRGRELSRPLPGRCRQPDSLLRRGGRGHPIRGRAARRRRGGATATRPRTRSSSSRSTTSRSNRSWTRSSAAETPGPASPPTASFRLRRPGRRLRRQAHLVVSERFSVPSLERHAGRVLRRRGRLGRGAGDAHGLGELPGARSRCTASPPPRSACPAAKLRLITPPDSGGSYGIKASVFAYVVLHRAGLDEARRARALDRGQDRAPRRRARARPRASPTCRRRLQRTASCSASGTTPSRMWAPTSGPPSRPRSTACTARSRAPTACSNVAARNRVVLTNRCPTGLNRGFGGPQLYLALERTMAMAARRLGLDPAELARRQPRSRADQQPYRTPSGGLYDSGDYPACLDDVLRLARYERAARRAGAGARGRSALRHRPRLRGRAVDLEHGLHHAGPDGRGAGRRAAEVGQRGGRKRAGRRRTEASAFALRRRRRDRATRPSARRSSPTRSASHRRTSRFGRRSTRRRAPGRSRPVPTHLGSPGWAPGPFSAQPSRLPTRRAASQRTSSSARPRTSSSPRARRSVRGNPERSLSLRRIAGIAHWNPESLPERDGRRAPGDRLLRRAEPRSARRAGPGRLVGGARLHRRRRRRRGRPCDRRGARPRLRRPCTTPAGCSTRLLVDGQVRGGFAHGAGAALFERTVYDEDGNLLTGSFMDYLCPTAPDSPAAHVGPPGDAVARSRRSARRALGEGNTMSAPAAIANAVADALGRDDVELPLTPPRVWAAPGLEPVKPRAVSRTCARRRSPRRWPRSRSTATRRRCSPAARASCRC